MERQLFLARNSFRYCCEYGSMKLTLTLVLNLAGIGIADAQEVAPRHEIVLTLGGLFGAQGAGGSIRLCI